MAGHSKFKNIQHRKGAQDQKRAKLFTKLVREIITAAKVGGIDPSSNPRLRNSISAARSKNLPRERIDKALRQATDPLDQNNYSENRYEGLLPGGIAIIIETLTDNKNRTVSEIRSAFTKYGGALVENGSISFQFDHWGKIVFASSIDSKEGVFEKAVELGAIDVETTDDEHIIYTEVNMFTHCLDGLTALYADPVDCGIEWKPQNIVLINEEDKANKLLRLIDALEESDDVQRLFGNYRFSAEILNKFSN